MRAKPQSRIRWMQELSRRENLKLKLDIKKNMFSVVLYGSGTHRIRVIKFLNR